jgi:hypothetical protein
MIRNVHEEDFTGRTSDVREPVTDRDYQPSIKVEPYTHTVQPQGHEQPELNHAPVVRDWFRS